MSLNPCPIDPVPPETARVARAAFPKGNRYMTMREELGLIYPNDLFADLYPQVGHYGEPPWRLALVTLMQFSENRIGRLAVGAVRGRIDWKYALGLTLTDPGFDFIHPERISHAPDCRCGRRALTDDYARPL